MSHLARIEIARFLVGLLDGAAAVAVRDHLDECGDCRAAAKRWERALSPRYDMSVAPGPAVKRRIVNALAEAGAPRGAFFSIPRPALAAASVIVAVTTVVGAIALYRTIGPGRIAPAALSLVKSRGDVLVNDAPCRAGIEIASGESLTVERGGRAVLSHGTSIEIIIAEGSVFRVIAATRDRRTGALDFSFMLERGALLSRAHHGAAPLTYAYETPHARVESHGTEFLLEAGPQGTGVLVHEGSVTVRSRATGAVRAASQGSAYQIAEAIRERPLSAPDMKKIEAIKRLMTPPGDRMRTPAREGKRMTHLNGNGTQAGYETSRTSIRRGDKTAAPNETLPVQDDAKRKRDLRHGAIPERGSHITPDRMMGPVKRAIVKKLFRNRR